jgi:hypothetical protein
VLDSAAYLVNQDQVRQKLELEYPATTCGGEPLHQEQQEQQLPNPDPSEIAAASGQLVDLPRHYLPVRPRSPNAIDAFGGLGRSG